MFLRAGQLTKPDPKGKQALGRAAHSAQRSVANGLRPFVNQACGFDWHGRIQIGPECGVQQGQLLREGRATPTVRLGWRGVGRPLRVQQNGGDFHPHQVQILQG